MTRLEREVVPNMSHIPLAEGMIANSTTTLFKVVCVGFMENRHYLMSNRSLDRHENPLASAVSVEMVWRINSDIFRTHATSEHGIFITTSSISENNPTLAPLASERHQNREKSLPGTLFLLCWCQRSDKEEPRKRVYNKL